MPAHTLNCPNCGARIYFTDDQCLSCGAQLDEGELSVSAGVGWAATEETPQEDEEPQHLTGEPARSVVEGGRTRTRPLTRTRGSPLCIVLMLGFGAWQVFWCSHSVVTDTPMRVSRGESATRGYVALPPSDESGGLADPWSLEWWMVLGWGVLFGGVGVYFVSILLRRRKQEELGLPQQPTASSDGSNSPMMRWKDLPHVGLAFIVVALVFLIIVCAGALPQTLSALRGLARPLLILGVAGGLLWYGIWGVKRWSRGQGSLVGPCVALVVVGLALLAALLHALWYVVGAVLVGA